jgi:hypothetical protein
LEQIDEAYVLQAARLAGLELKSEQISSVLEHLRRTASLARLLEDFVLPTEEEIGPTWRP